MEFHEKLQALRKQRQWTQEQLAEKLYVSRTAVSKWESGKGYPNIESLKALSGIFEFSIDDLLSGKELIVAAKSENNANLKRVYSSITGVIDLLTLTFFFLPLYGNPVNDGIRSVNLFSFTAASPIIRALYWAVFIVLIATGILELFLMRSDCEKWNLLARKFSLALSAVSVLLFAAVKEPYVTALMFLSFSVKLYLLVQQGKLR